MKSSSEQASPHIALFIVNLIYGLNFVIAKDIMPLYILPSGFILLRVLGANLLFWSSHAFYPSQRIERADWWRFILGGFFGVATNQLLFFKGLNLTTPIQASIIMVSTPVMVLIIGAILANERLTWLKVLGIIIGASGAIYLITPHNNGGLDAFASTGLGNLLVALNATAYAIYMVIAKPLMKKYKPLFVIKWMFLFGMLFVIPFGWQDFLMIKWHTFPLDITLKTIYVVVGVTYITYLFNMYALRYLNASVVSIYIYFQPAVAAVYAILTGKDILTLSMIISCMLIFIGVFLVSRKSV